MHASKEWMFIQIPRACYSRTQSNFALEEFLFIGFNVSLLTCLCWFIRKLSVRIALNLYVVGVIQGI